MKTVAIIGGGFSGTITAVNLARLSREPLRLCLINHGYPLGRGVAYGTRRPEHVLNVVARNMSALADHPSHFVDWLRTRAEYAGVPEAELRERFMPRRVYGDYLQGLLFWYSGLADTPVRLERIEGEAVDLLPGGALATVVIEGGRTVEAHKVVLATGNQAPADVIPGPPCEHPRYCKNPWQGWEDRLPDRTEAVVLLGTGLTTIDAYLTLAEMGWQGKVHAVSRTGLLPLSHFKGIDYPAFPPGDPSTLGLAGLVALIEEHCGRLRARGANPAIVVDRLRPHTQRIWQNLSAEEKQEFSRRHRQRWNVTRHRIPQAIHEQLGRAMADGRLEVVKASVRRLEGIGDRVRVTVETETGPKVLDAGLVLNCTGPQESYTRSPTPLFQNLFFRGLLSADELDMGVRVADDFAVVGRSGQPSDFLYAIGPLLKGTLWETTAVPELRIQAFRAAETMIETLEGATRRGRRLGEMVADVLEYCI